MVLEKTIKREGLYKEYLTLINGITKLTEKEKDIVEYLLVLNDLHDEVLSTENRKKVREQCKITELNLNNHISNLKKKGIIQDIKGVLTLNGHIVPNFINGCVVVVYRLNID